MKVLVTGATGFIGRRLVERLQKDGVDVIALVRDPNHGLPEGVRPVYGDILSPESFGDHGQGCDRLFHLAALITFDPSKRGDLIKVNAEGTAAILKAARRWEVKRSVVLSSACTIGLSYAADRIMAEDALLEDKLIEANPYMESKILAEREAFKSAREQEVVVVNPTTVYGPGDWRLNSGTLVLTIAGSQVLPVPPGGSNVVDVDDVVEGLLAAGERGESGRRYILGGENLLFQQIFQIIAQVVGRSPIRIPIPGWMRKPIAAASGLAGRVLGGRFLTPQIVSDLFAFKFYSSARAQQELGWNPRYTFQESVQRAWAFYCQEGLLKQRVSTARCQRAN